jgi:hypothetical protein
VREPDEQFMERMRREKRFPFNVADINRGRQILHRQAMDRIWAVLERKGAKARD